MTLLVAEPQEYDAISSLGPDHDMFVEEDEDLGYFYVRGNRNSNLPDEAVVSGSGGDGWYVYEGNEYAAGTKLPDEIAEQLQRERPPAGFRNLTVGDVWKLLKDRKRKDPLLIMSVRFRDMLESYKDLVDEYHKPKIKLLFDTLIQQITRKIKKYEKGQLKNPPSKTKRAFTSVMP